MSWDHYKTLEVNRDASDAEIKKAYRRLALKYHPDRNTSTDANQKFVSIQQAYDILGDPEKRKQYDLIVTKTFVDYFKEKHQSWDKRYEPWNSGYRRRVRVRYAYYFDLQTFLVGAFLIFAMCMSVRTVKLMNSNITTATISHEAGYCYATFTSESQKEYTVKYLKGCAANSTELFIYNKLNPNKASKYTFFTFWWDAFLVSLIFNLLWFGINMVGFSKPKSKSV